MALLGIGPLVPWPLFVPVLVGLGLCPGLGVPDFREMDVLSASDLQALSKAGCGISRGSELEAEQLDFFRLNDCSSSQLVNS